MLIGYAPFCSKHTNEVCQKVLNWKKFLKIPSKKKVSKDAEDLIFKLINNPNERLGIRGADEIKKHPFFKDMDFQALEAKKIEAPFKPILQDSFDVTNFDDEFTSEELVSSEITEKNMDLIKRNQDLFDEFGDDNDD